MGAWFVSSRPVKMNFSAIFHVCSKAISYQKVLYSKDENGERNRGRWCWREIKIYTSKIDLRRLKRVWCTFVPFGRFPSKRCPLLTSYMLLCRSGPRLKKDSTGVSSAAVVIMSTKQESGGKRRVSLTLNALGYVDMYVVYLFLSFSYILPTFLTLPLYIHPIHGLC